MRDKVLVDEWLEIADDDLDVAQYLYAREHRKPLEIICYHCQQAAEKSLKAYLCASGVEVPKTHETGVLCHRCHQFNTDFSRYFVDCEELETYATETRYPRRIELDNHHAQQALQQATAIFSFVSEQIQKMVEEESQAPTQIL